MILTPVPHIVSVASKLNSRRRKPPGPDQEAPPRIAISSRAENLHLEMRPDELPVYPTPQQASFSASPQNNAPPRKPKSSLRSGSGGNSAHSHGHPSQQHSRLPIHIHHSQQQLQPQDSYSLQGGRAYHQQLQAAPPPQLSYGSSPQLYVQQNSQGPPAAPYQNYYNHGNHYQQQEMNYQNQGEPYINHGPPPIHPSQISQRAHSYHNSPERYQSSPAQQSSNRQPTYAGQSSNPGVADYSNEQISPNQSSQIRKKPPLTSGHSNDSSSDSKSESKQRLEAELRSTFERVDADRTGRISLRELSSALVNFDNTGFQDSTVQLMIKLFTTSRSPAGLNFEQFLSLWKYLTAYRKLFVAADTNKSGDISFGEFQRILEQIGYKLNVDVVLHLFLKFVNKDDFSFTTSTVGKLKFDAFIELLMYIRKLTDIFKQYDKDLSGVATINYLDFLMEISNLT